MVEELSATAQAVVLPALLKKVKAWIGVDLSDQTSNKSQSLGSNQESRSIGKI
jgi:DNA mismatch repair protein MutH